ncbi:MAG TPA: dihydrolipoamide acetyltransferase family protein [Steroidobacteraceae bacterium]|nr:dihydrolipoamide acetyltransferase family protein [Steroidobacteraceae bacterium]
MSRYVFKLPDLGEGTVDAEIVCWRVKPGEVIAEDDALVEMMTEKATVEVPSPVGGRVVSVTGTPGDRVTVGSELAVFETDATTAATATAAATTSPAAPANGSSGATRAASPAQRATPAAEEPAATRAGRVLTSPAIRRQAREAGVDLTSVAGTGPSGRIMRNDLLAHLQARSPEDTAAPRPATARASGAADSEEIKVIGLRRVIADRMSESARTIPHFSYVEEVDVTELERLRTHLNGKRGGELPPLTYLPFLILALTRTLAEHPHCNGLYDAARGVIVRHRAVHVGVATQTRDGLKVPVIRDAERRSLEELARELRRLSEAARANKATRAELAGSTITVTSLGKLGGIASTPIINAPELAIVGVNRAVERPVVVGGGIAVRRMMNLSSSFDHRFVDGHDAAAMIQSLKERLENPATIFMP